MERRVSAGVELLPAVDGPNSAPLVLATWVFSLVIIYLANQVP